MNGVRLFGLFLVMSMFAIAGCASGSSEKQRVAEPTEPGLQRLADWMEGSFSSAAQASRSDEYFDIRLEMVRIWPEHRGDQVWLYVEQATTSSLDRPYRQRIYRLERIGENRFVSAVYELPPDPLAFAGWWQTPQLFDRLSPSDLSELTGCSVYLQYMPSEDRFVGSTEIGTCESTLRGAAYVVSEVTITPNLLLTWDRGFDADGEQAWGAVDGGYEFMRVE